MKHWITIGLVLSLSSLLPAAPLKIVTWNIYNRPWEREARLPNLAKVVTDLNPDILALQEVAEGQARPGQPVELLTEALEKKGTKFYSFKAWHEKNKGYVQNGVGLVSRFPFKETEYQRFHDYDWLDPKGFIWAVLDTPDGPLGVLTLHMSSTEASDIKESQFGQITTFLKAKNPGFPVVIAGDFNTNHANPAFQKFTAAFGLDNLFFHFPKGVALNTWSPAYKKFCNYHNPADGDEAEQIDYVLSWNGNSGKTVELLGGGVEVSQLRPNPSDHCAVHATFQLSSIADNKIQRIP